MSNRIDRREALKAGGMAAALFGWLGGAAVADPEPPVIEAEPLKPGLDPVRPEPNIDIERIPPQPRPPAGAWWVRRLDMQQEMHDVTFMGDSIKQSAPAMAEITLEIVSPDGSQRMTMVCIQANLSMEV